MNCSDCKKDLVLLCMSLVFVHGVSLIRYPIASFPMLEWNDILDLCGVFLLLWCYWAIVSRALQFALQNHFNNKSTKVIGWESIYAEVSKTMVPFLFSVSLLCLGWGAHNSANANSHLFYYSDTQAEQEWINMEEQQAWFSKGSFPTRFSITNMTLPFYTVPKFCNWAMIQSFYLTDFYDEHLGHILSHIGWCMLDSLILVQYWNIEVTSLKSKGQSMLQTFLSVCLMGLIAGCFFFARSIEGQTAKWIAIPWSLTLSVVCFNKFITTPAKLLKQPIITFLFVQYITALWLILSWAIYHGSFVEFSKLGYL